MVASASRTQPTERAAGAATIRTGLYFHPATFADAKSA
jgi:hypothetical protein